MAPQPFHDGVLKLAQASDASRARALLRAATELFVGASAHGRAEVAMYEELALQLLRITPVEDRRAVAGMLCRHPQAPAAVMRALLHDEIAVAEVVLDEAEHLLEVDLLALVATGTDRHLAALAARHDLSRDVVEALVRNMPREALPALLSNTSIRIPPHLVGYLIEAARGLPAVARALARRQEDIEDTDLTEIFLDLDDKGRRRVVQALEILALRDFAAKRPLPRLSMPDPEKVERLARASLSRDTMQMADGLADLLSLDRSTAMRLLTDPGGEPLAIALRAAGLDAPIATRVILFSGEADVRSYFEVKRLVDLFETVSFRAAAMLLRRWRGDGEPLPVRRRHVPVAEAGTPPRGAGADTRRPDTPAREEVRSRA